MNEIDLNRILARAVLKTAKEKIQLAEELLALVEPPPPPPKLPWRRF
jgi:hypothetical protein